MRTTRRRNDDDEGHGILRDGEVRRVPLYLRDGGDGWRADMPRHFHGDGRFGFDDVADRRKKRTVRYDPRGRLSGTSETEIEEDDAMHDVAPRRPGFTDEALDRIEEAYQQSEQRDANAWRNLRSHGEADVRSMMGDRWGGKVGSECTINGAPGHLKMVRGELQCVPDDNAQDAAPRLTGDAALDAELVIAAGIDDPVARAYAEREALDAHAWKKPL
jgi:hypothetical protein